MGSTIPSGNWETVSSFILGNPGANKGDRWKLQEYEGMRCEEITRLTTGGARRSSIVLLGVLLIALPPPTAVAAQAGVLTLNNYDVLNSQASFVGIHRLGDIDWKAAKPCHMGDFRSSSVFMHSSCHPSTLDSRHLEILNEVHSHFSIELMHNMSVAMHTFSVILV